MRNLRYLTPRILVALWAVLISFVTSAFADYQSTVLSQGPVGYWRLSETTPVPNLSTVATNLGTGGSLLNGTYQGGLAGRGAPGAVAGDPGAFFDGTSEYINVVPPLTYGGFNPAEFSVECWFMPVGPGNTTCIMSMGDFTSARRGWLVYQSLTNQVQFRTYNGVNATAVNFNINSNFVLGTYHHLAITRSNTTFRCYINGVQLAAGIPVAPNAYVGPNPGDNFTIGVRATPYAFPWAGAVDELAYYTNFLTPDKVMAHFQAATTNAAGYAAQIQAENPLMYFRLNEPALPLSENLGSLGTDATARMIYPAVSADPGPQSPAFPGLESTNVGIAVSGSQNSGGAGGYATVPSLELNTNGVTITCWVKPNGIQAGSAGIVMSRSELSSPSTGTTAGIIIDQAGGLDLSYNWDGDNATTAWLSTVGMTDSQWNFVSLIVQPDKAVLFVPNGSNPNPSTNFHTHGVLEFDGSTTFGTDLALSGFNGSVDEVAIFQRALTMGEVYTQYGMAVSNVAPRIFTDPTAPAGTLYAGDSLTLAVDAGGTPPLSYQWRKNGTDLPGETSSALALALVAGGPNNYDVKVGNVFATNTSAAASITVSATTTPTIVTDIPYTGRTIYPGGAIKLGVAAVGGGITYQWQLYGSNLPGQTASSLSINNINAGNGGPYQLRLTNSAGNASSVTANIAVANPGAGSYGALITADAPVSWWRMDDALASPFMLDSMGRFDGGYSNAVTLNVTGALTNDSNKAANFTSAAGWGEVPLPLPVATGDITYELWVRSSDTTSDMVPFSSFRSKYGFYFERQPDNTWRGRDGYGELDAGSARQALIGDFTAGQWTHLVATYSGANGHRVYINGRWDGNSYIDWARNINTPIRVGSVDPLNSYGQQRWFTGDIDEVAIYDKALTGAQILQHYLVGLYSSNNLPVFAQQPTPQTVFIGQTATFTTLIEGSPTITNQWYKNGVAIPNATNANYSIANAQYADAIGNTYFTIAANGAGNATSAVVTLTVLPQPTHIVATNGMVLHLKFDGTYTDSSGKGHHGTAVGSPQFVAGVVGSGALQYATAVTDPSGHGGGVISADYVTLGVFTNGTDLSFSNNHSFSVAYWIRTPTNKTSGDLPVFCSAQNSYGNAGLTFAPSYNQGGWSWSLGDNATFAGVYGAAGSIDNGDWHHVAHTFNRANGQGRTYLDGVFVNSTGFSVLDNIDTFTAFNIGQDTTGNYPEAATNYVDDLAVWKDYLLTSVEIYSAFYAGKNYGRSFDTLAPISIQLVPIGSNYYIVWQDGTLKQADDITGPWTNVPGAAAPYYQIPTTSPKKFYRVQ